MPGRRRESRAALELLRAPGPAASRRVGASGRSARPRATVCGITAGGTTSSQRRGTSRFAGGSGRRAARSSHLPSTSALGRALLVRQHPPRRSSAVDASASSSGAVRASAWANADMRLVSRRSRSASPSSGTSWWIRSAAASQSASSTSSGNERAPGCAAGVRERQQQAVDRAVLEEAAAPRRVARELVDHEVAPARVHPHDARRRHDPHEVVGQPVEQVDGCLREAFGRMPPRRREQLALAHGPRRLVDECDQQRAVLGCECAVRLGHRRGRLGDLRVDGREEVRARVAGASRCRRSSTKRPIRPGVKCGWSTIAGP